MLTQLLFKQVKAGVGILTPSASFPSVAFVEFDASITETHTEGADVTEHPVEFGSNISDHIRVLPETIEITGVITNTPIIWLASMFSTSPVVGDLKKSSDRVNAGNSQLSDFIKKGQVLDVITSLKTYSNMVITNKQITRDSETGNILDCTLSLREIVMAKSLSIDVPVPVDATNNKPKNSGRKQASSADTTTQQSSAANTPTSSLYSAFGSFLGG